MPEVKTLIVGGGGDFVVGVVVLLYDSRNRGHHVVHCGCRHEGCLVCIHCRCHAALSVLNTVLTILDVNV